MITPTHASLTERIRELGDWFHNLYLDGIATAPNHFLGDYPQVKWQRFRHVLPLDLTGKTVLDIGCNAGFYALEMKRRNAAQVVAIDTDVRYLAQARLAAEIQNLSIEFRLLSVYEIDELQQKFDIVLFMGVFYHLRYPLLALDLIREHVVKDLFLFQSMLRGSDEVLPLQNDYSFEEIEVFKQPGYPVLHFVEQNYCADPTNWWIPNQSCVEAMLRSAQFTILAHPEEEVFLCRAHPEEKLL